MTEATAATDLGAAIAERLDGVEVISFDVFDTLFLRPFADAEHLFDLVGTHHGIEGFRAIRQQAQREAFREMQRQGRREIDIELIYEQMPARLAVPAETLMRTEIELEHAATQPNDEMLAIYRRLVEDGRRVVLTSDMYLHASFFRKLLQDHDLPDVPMFISADRDATKRDHGALFDLLAEETGTAPERILHVGDNTRSDIERARERGLRTFHYVEPFLPPKLKDITPAESLARGLMRLRNQMRGDQYFRLGYEVGGPAALGWLHWIEGRAREEGIDHLLLVSRDGYILDRIAKLAVGRFDLPAFSYFEGSRVAFKLAAMEEKTFETFLPFLLSGSGGLAVDELFWRIGVPAPSAKVLADLGLGGQTRVAPEPQQAIKQLLRAMRHEILIIGAACRRGLYRHLHGRGIRNGDRVGFADIGWNGTTQEALSEALSGMMTLDLYGYYLCLADTSECRKRRAKASMTALLDEDSLPSEVLAKVYENRVIAEFFFSAPHLPVIGYRPVANGVSSTLDPGRSLDTLDHAARVDSAQDGMLAFVRDYLDQEKRLGVIREPLGLARPLVDLLNENAPNAHPAFANMKGFDAWGSSRNLS